MKKALCIVDDNEPALKTMVDEIQQHISEAIAQMDFMKKKMEQVRDSCHEKKAAVWRRIEAHLTAQNKLPADFKHDTHPISYDPETKVLVLDTDPQPEPNGLEMLKKLFT